ncbi:hypothetical protein AgCh_001438 [Apium graveolens]
MVAKRVRDSLPLKLKVNMLYLKSPAGVGFSFSSNKSFFDYVNDEMTELSDCGAVVFELEPFFPEEHTQSYEVKKQLFNFQRMSSK